MDELITFEKMLLKQPTRSDTAVLQRLLADDFLEFGASGMAFGKKEVLERLPQETSDTQITGYDFKVTMISETVGLVTFKASKLENGQTRLSLRSSLWAKRDGNWQMVFHQGTVLSHG